MSCHDCHNCDHERNVAFVKSCRSCHKLFVKVVGAFGFTENETGTESVTFVPQ